MPGETPIRRHAAWGLACLALLVVSPYFERLNNPNENVRVWATRAVVQHHVLNIDELQREWGYVNDKAKNEHHIYSGKAPGVSFVGVPVAWAHTKLRGLVGWPPPGKRETTFWLRLFAVKLPLCLFLFFFARYVERTTGSAYARDLLVSALGLGTLLYPYGGMFVGHALAAATAFTAFMLLRRRARRDACRCGWRCAGLFAGLTVMFEYQAALVSAALAVYAGVRYRRRLAALAAFVAGAVPPAVALGIYHTVLFGRPWRLPLGNVENPVFARTAHSAGFHGLSVPQLEAFPAFLFSPAYGLFAFSPVLALGVAGVVVLFARARQMPGARRDAALVTAVCVLMFTFLAGMSNWRARLVRGAALHRVGRAVPGVADRSSCGRASGAKWWATALVVGLTIPSVVLNVVSGALYPHYPEQYDNPVFDLAFPLLGAGYAPLRARSRAAPAGGVGDGAAGAGGRGGAGAGHGGRRPAAAARRRPRRAGAGDRGGVSARPVGVRAHAAPRRGARNRHRATSCGSRPPRSSCRN